MLVCSPPQAFSSPRLPPAWRRAAQGRGTSAVPEPNCLLRFWCPRLRAQGRGTSAVHEPTALYES